MLKINVEEKLSTVVNRLNALRTVKRTPISATYSDKVNEKGEFYGNDGDFLPFPEPHTLFETEKYYRFKMKFSTGEIPPAEKAYFCAETFIGGVPSTIRPQGILKLNGELAQGIDINHAEVLLKEGEYEADLIFYTHLFERSLPLRFSVRYENELVKDAYYDFAAVLSAMKLLLEKTDEYVFTKYHLERAMNLIDFRNPYDENFFSSLKAAREYLKENYFGKYSGNCPVVNCVGHTHIDVAWLWDEEQTKQKTVRSFATVLKLMEEYPEYKFMMSQPQLFAFLKERNPELYGKIKEKVKEGRWELDGAMWLEADCNLTSGESLVRQIYYGKKFFKDEFGADCSCVWEPDVFGYSAALPQIMKKSGINRFVTAKIGWNDTDRMPYDAFVWHGIDGSKVFAYLISTCVCDPRAGVYDKTYTTYTGPIDAQAVLGTWHRFEPKEFNDVTLLSYGYGDGGGGPTREMLENEKRLAAGVAGIPRTKLATLKETLDEAENNFNRTANELKRFPKWNGELYFEYHRGTLSSVPRIKKNNRKGEFAVMNAEFLSAFSSKVSGAMYDKDELEGLWKLLLLNQFHDILPGSAIKKVYEDSDEQFKKIFAETSDISAAAINALSENIRTEGGTLVINPNGFPYEGTMVFEGKIAVIKEVPAFGYKVIRSVACEHKSVSIKERSAENDIYRVEFDDYGNVISLFDKRANRETVKRGEKLNEFRAYEDMPYEYDNWEIAPYHKQKEYLFDKKAKFEIYENGAAAGFKITREYGCSSVSQTVCLYEGLDRIDFITDVCWKEKNQLLKVRFPFDLLVDKATYDIQFGSVERSTSENTSWDSARFECAAQKWVDMAENDYGISLLNDGKYGFGAEGNVLTMTIAKCGGFPYYEASENIPQFTYSLVPHEGDFRKAKVINKAYALNRGVMTQKVESHSGALQEEFSFVRSLTEGVFAETVKSAENGEGTIIRVYEAFKERKKAEIAFGLPFENAFICDLSENETEKAKTENGKIVFDIKPFEIVTLKVI